MKTHSSSQPVTKQELSVELRLLKKEFKKDFVYLDRRIDGLDEKFDGLNKNFRDLEKKFDKLEAKFDTKTQEIKDYMNNLVDWVVSEIRTMQIEHTVQTQNIPAMREQIDQLDERVGKLELAIR